MTGTQDDGRRRPGRRVLATLGARWVQALMALGLVAALAVGGALLARRASAAALTVCSSCTYKSINDAIVAASAGDTINVQAGTYGPNETGAANTDAEIKVTKPLTITGAGVGQSLINAIPTADITGDTPFTASPVMLIQPAVAGNVTISGFTFEGATYNGGGNLYGQYVAIYDNNSSDVITIKNNQFYSDSTLDPTNRLDQIDAIYPADGTATVNVTNNRFQGIFRAMLAEGWAGPLSFTNNDLNLHGLYDSMPSNVIDYWAEGVFLLADSGANLSAPATITGNTFESYAGMAVGMSAGYSGGLVGALSNVTIANNTFDNQGVLGAQDSQPDSAAIYLHGFGTSTGSVFSSIWGVTIKNNVFNGGSATGHGYAVALKGAMGGSIVMDHNVMLGGGSSRPLAGVQFLAPSNTTGVSITNNIITGYATGVASDALPSGALVTASQNCIMSNTAGAGVASGVNLDLASNWWGAASGPAPSGSGNGVSGSATYTPFLTSPAAICAGPVVSNVTPSTNPVNFQTSFNLTATVSDATTSGFGVDSAWFTVNGGPTYPLYWSGGPQVTVNATGHVLLSGAGRITVCAQGKDVFGNVGPATCYVEVVLQATPTTTTASGTPSATATSGAGATATPGTNPQPTATTQATATATATPGSAGQFFGIDMGSFPWVPVCLGIVILLVIIGLAVFFVRRRQANEQA